MRTIIRKDERKFNELRTISLDPNYLRFAHGSCLVKFGNTHVICSATIEEKVPSFLRNTGYGWITAEYSMLPCSTHERSEREVIRGKQSGRTQEIQRLIGRVFRSVVNLKAIGERQIKLDCDVIQADGGTRSASITGSYVALYMALIWLGKKKSLYNKIPIINQIAAISCGIIQNEIYLDLDYNEDSNSDVDANFIIADNGKIVEIQTTAEKSLLHQDQLNLMLDFARNGINSIMKIQNRIINEIKT